MVFNFFMKIFDCEHFLEFACLFCSKNCQRTIKFCLSSTWFFKSFFTADKIFLAIIKLRFSDDVLIQERLNLSWLWNDFSIRLEGDCFSFVVLSIILSILIFFERYNYPPMLISWWDLTELCKHVIVCDERHKVDKLVGCSPLFSKHGILSITGCWPKYEPVSTFIKQFAFGFSSYSNHCCRVCNLLNFKSLKSYQIVLIIDWK